MVNLRSTHNLFIVVGQLTSPEVAANLESAQADDMASFAESRDADREPIERERESIRLRLMDYVLIGLSVAVGRAAYSWGRTSFTLAPDEVAVGGMARYLSGTDSFNMLIASTWRPGLSTLLAPIFWFTSDPELFVRIALVVNAVVAGIGAIWLARLAQRLTTLTRFGLVATVITISLTPASLSASSFVWAEPLVTLTFLAAMWYVLQCQDDPTMRACIAAIGWSLIGFTTHGRMLPFVLLVTSAVCLTLLRRQRWRHAAAAAGIAGIGTALSSWYANYVFNSVWDVQGDENSAGSVLAKLRDPLAILDSATGQFWYLLVTTVTLFGIGMFVFIQSAIVPRSGPLRSLDARTILFLTLPLLAVSIVFTSDRGRSDFFVYGRYNDAIIGPILVVAVAWLLFESRSMTQRSWWLLVGGMATVTLELGLVTNQLHGSRLAEASLLPMISGLQPMGGATWGVDVLSVTVVSLLIATVVFSVSRWSAHSERGLLALAAIMLLVAGVMSHIVFGYHQTVPASAVVEVEEQYLEPHQPILVAYIPQRFNPEVPFVEQRARVLLYQWYLPGHEFDLLRFEDQEPGTVVFGTPSDPYLKSLGAVQLWLDPAGSMALWRIGDPPAVG